MNVYDGSKKVNVTERWEICQPPKAISQMLDKVIPIGRVKQMQDEQKKAQSQEELKLTDAWLIRLFRKSPLHFWLSATAIGLVFIGLSFGFGAFLDWITR